MTGWMLELGYFPHASATSDAFECAYRIYITGDTLLVDELGEMHARYAGKKIDLMIMHLGGTILPEPHPPSLVSMDASQGLELLQLIKPDLTMMTTIFSRARLRNSRTQLKLRVWRRKCFI